jgi:hypothetical protein
MAGLVPATHEHLIVGVRLRMGRCELTEAEIMGGWDKPGHDESFGSGIEWTTAPSSPT